VIFQSANEINQNILLKARIAEMQVDLDADKTWWANKRAGIQSQFMAELEGDAEDAAAAVVPPAVQTTKKANSDDDAVLVEAGGPAQQQGGGKKKGKK
jgi:translocation protein SEC66